MRVDFGMLRQSESDGFDHYVVERHLVLIAHLRQLRTQLRCSRGIVFGGEKESRDRAVRFGETSRDRLSDLSERNVFEISLGRETFGCGRPSDTARPLGVLDVALDDATARPSSLDGAELNSFLVRESARER